MAKLLKLKTLNALNHQVDCECSKSCFLEVGHLLKESDLQNLKPTLKMYGQYILGKYQFRLSKISQPKNHLELANAHFDEVFRIAGTFQIRKSKYWFKRVHTKYELAKLCNPQDAVDLLLKAKELVVPAHQLFPENSSITWLYNELFK